MVVCKPAARAFRGACACAWIALGACDGPSGEAPGSVDFGLELLTLDESLPYATDFAFIPGRPELLIALKDGRLLHYRLEGDRLTTLGEVSIDVYDDEDCGLISLAFDPEFIDNGVVYLGLCTSAQESGVFRHTFDPEDHARTESRGAAVVVQAEERATEPWHNVGAIAFDSSGSLWVAFGDKTVSANARDTDNALGGVLRISPERAAEAGGYRPAAGNPLIGMGGEEGLYGWGLRSPWRLAIDAHDRAWIGDVGLDDQEEVNLVDAPGLDFGWPVAEGPCASGCEGLRESLTAWSHDEEHPYVLDDPDARPTTLRVAWVGTQYVPADNDRYEGRLAGGMLFGDTCLGNLRIAEADQAGALVRDEHLAHLPSGIIALHAGPDDFLYGLSMGGCVTNGSDPPAASFYRLVLDRRP